MLFELLFRPAFLVLAFSVVCLCLYFLKYRHKLPDLPVVGANEDDWFPFLQAKWRNTRNFQAALEYAYANYKDRAVILPVVVSGNLVLLPPSELEFVVDQPDSVLSFSQQVIDQYQVDFTFMDPAVPRATIHESLLRTTLTPKISKLVPVLADEVVWAFEKHWGTDTAEWHEVNVFDTMRYIVGSVANRTFVGLPHCRNPELVNTGMAFAEDIPLSSIMINLFWKPLRPFVAPFITIPNRIHTKRFRKILKSEIARRLRDYDARLVDPEDKSITPEPDDLLQWSIQQAMASGNPYMRRNQTLADRILMVNFAAIHTTSFTATWAMFDLVSSSPEILDELRKEITSVLAINDGKWTKKALAELVKLDSAIRESARLSSILTIGLVRVVVAEEGMTTLSGLHLSKGTRIALPAYSIMRDETSYKNAKKYSPFRFSEQHNNYGSESTKRVPNALPVTSPNFLIFGHGRHACPGRYFAAAELKLIMAHALLRYDFEMQTVKEEGSWFGATRVPPMKATIKIRKRRKT